MPEPRRRAPRAPVGLILVCLMVMGAALAVILDRRGPYSGWIASLRHRLVPQASPKATEAPPPESPPPPSAPTPVKPAAATAQPSSPAGTEDTVAPVPKIDLETRYSELYQRFLAELPRPRIGRTYELRTRRGESIRGKLEKLEPGLVTLRLKHGTMAYPVHVLAREDVLKLFPEIAARSQALLALQKGEEPKQPDAAPAQAAIVAPSPIAAPAPVGATPSGTPGELRYDPTPGPTPEELKPTLLAFGDWLKTQHRRVGGRIADKIFARRQGGCAVLYLRMDPTFLAQEYGTRYQIAEGMQTFWGLRCESNSVASVAQAHVVLLDQSGRIVGGSRPYAASEIWLSNR